MEFLVEDFNEAGQYYAAAGAPEWEDLDEILRRLPVFFQPSGQAGLDSRPIFDPKATNHWLTRESGAKDWNRIPVPQSLKAFGRDWDAGKAGTLAEWQFSNYPFLWNNVIRSEAVRNGEVDLPDVTSVEALTIVTKSGSLPASNSTLYFEQARAQLQAVTALDAFAIPIRLVGLTVPAGDERIRVTWSEYPARYGREPDLQMEREMEVTWGPKRRLGYQSALFTPTDEIEP